MAITSAELRIPEPLRYMPLVVAAILVVLTSLIDGCGCVIWAKTGVRPPVWHGDDLDHRNPFRRQPAVSPMD